jgi:hypothetical protein
MVDGHENIDGYTFCRPHADYLNSLVQTVDDSDAIAAALGLNEHDWYELKKRYTYHPPKGDQLDRYRRIREGCLALAALIVGNTPASREQSVALTALDSVIFNANAAIARNE